MKTFIKSIYALKILLLLLCFPVLFTVCGQNNTQTEGNNNGKLSIVTTIFPYYDFTRQVAGDKADIKLIVPAGMDTHSFEPVASDMIDIGKADIIIYNGGETEGWASQVLEAASNKNITVEGGSFTWDVSIYNW